MLPANSCVNMKRRLYKQIITGFFLSCAKCLIASKSHRHRVQARSFHAHKFNITRTHMSHIRTIQQKRYLPFVIGKWESWCGWNLCIIGNGIFVCDRWCLPPNAASRINPYTVRIQRQCWKLSYSADGVISCNYHLRIQQRNVRKEKRKFFRNA